MACARLLDIRDVTKTRGAFHLPRNSGWDVNGTDVFHVFHRKIPGNEWNFEKVVLLSC